MLKTRDDLQTQIAIYKRLADDWQQLGNKKLSRYLYKQAKLLQA